MIVHYMFENRGDSRKGTCLFWRFFRYFSGLSFLLRIPQYLQYQHANSPDAYGFCRNNFLMPTKI